MAELNPYPFAALARRMFRELHLSDSIFNLARDRFFPGIDGVDLGVDFHGRHASSPLGPAAGPQTQMAQNLVLSWLGGSRILELKTVQVLDRLQIPRPCIDMRTIGLNAEWSQELRLHDSLSEYAKGALLIEMLRSSGEIDLRSDFGHVIYDMSVGYDLKGIRSEPVAAFIRGMKNCSSLLEKLRAEIPSELSRLREVDIEPCLSDTLTLSTFHGCPPNEIESIIAHLMREHGLHCVVKFNPMLLGPQRCRHLLHDVLGYRHLRIPDSAFERDTTWEQAVEMMERLGELADSLDLGLGAKFTNTLIVENDGSFLPATEKEVYLSGAPLHVLAIELVARFRRRFGNRFAISFSAGIDRHNVADAVALGLAPVTACTDLLKTGGYGRQTGWYRELGSRMERAPACNREDYVFRAYGLGSTALERLGLGAGDVRRAKCLEALERGADLRAAAGDELYERWLEQVLIANAEHYSILVQQSARYRQDANARAPRKIGSHLELFDCITCDKCIPVCPNDANFRLHAEPDALPIIKLHREGTSWRVERAGEIRLQERHQIGNFADFCNDCGNCDVFCPEDGGPYVVKPRFFGSESLWRTAAPLDGFYVDRLENSERVLGRFGGDEYLWEVGPDTVRFCSDDTDLLLPDGDPDRARGEGPAQVDLTWGLIMDWLRRAVLDPQRVNYVNALIESPPESNEVGTESE